MAAPHLPILVIMEETFDSKALFAAVKAHEPRAALLETVPGILFRVVENGGDALPFSVVKPWFAPRARLLFYLTYPLHLLLVLFQSYLAFAPFFRRGGRIDHVLVLNPYVGFGLALWRRRGRVRHLSFMSGDWFAGTRATGGLWNRLGNNGIHPRIDRFFCRSSDAVWNVTEAIGEARRRHWGRPVARVEKTYQPRLTWLGPAVPAKPDDLPALLFLGRVRSDSGLEPLLREGPRCRLRHVGPPAPLLTGKASAGSAVTLESLGYLERARFPEAAAGCLAGLNLIDNPDSYSSLTLPAKILDYLQLGLPVLVTPHVGPMAGVLEREGLGLVLPRGAYDLAPAMEELRRSGAAFRARVEAWVKSRTGTPMAELFPDLG